MNNTVTQDAQAAGQKHCSACGEGMHLSAAYCPKCGARQPESQDVQPVQQPAPVVQSRVLGSNQVYCRGCGAVIHVSAVSCPKCGAVQRPAGGGSVSGKDRTTAALLAFLLGGFGGHKFYLGKWVQGIFYLLFFWTLIPGVIAFIEAIIYLTMSDADFGKKYP